MTRNDTPDKLEWSIRPRSGLDSAQWDWGITIQLKVKAISQSAGGSPHVANHV